MKKSTLFSLSSLTALLISTVAWGQTTIYSQDFEGNGLPAGWSQTTNATDGGWQFGTNSQLQSVSFPITSHTKMACTNDDACNCDKSSDMLISSSMDFSPYTHVFMSFDNFFYGLSYDGATESATILASTDGGAVWNTVKEVSGNTGDWETRYIDLSTYAGNSNVQIAFKYNDGGGWLYGWAMDNFKAYEPLAGFDVGVVSVDVGKLDPTPTFVSFAKYVTDWPLNVHAIISNQGTEPITSFDITWTDGANSHTESITGVNIPALGTYDYTSANTYTTLNGSHDVSITISNVNSGVTEIGTTNNYGVFTVSGITPNPDQKYLSEEATGTWCGWCIRGIVFMDYMREMYPDQFVGIAVHNADPMVVDDYDGWVGNYPGFQGYPSVIINRKYIVDPSQLEADLINNMANSPAVKVSVAADLNTVNNKLTATINGEFLQSLNGDYRFVAVLEEDSVSGTSSTYAQTNYYSINDYGYAGPMAGFENQSGHIPATQMHYDFVGRELLSEVKGTAGSLPAAIISGENHSYTYNFDVPSNYNVNRLKVVGMVVKYSTGEVLNVGSSALKFTTGISNISAEASLFVYPNPASDIAYVDLKLSQAADVSIEITNAIGQTLSMTAFGKISGDQIIPLKISDLASGIYQVKVKAGDQVLIKKLQVVN